MRWAGLVPSLLLLAAVSAEEAPPLLLSPEALVPPGTACFLKGAGFESLQAHLDAYCNRHPSPFASALRLQAAPRLGRPFLVAADGARPWGMMLADLARPQDRVWILPVEDVDAFRSALPVSLQAMPMKVVRGYAVLGADAALVERAGSGGEGVLPLTLPCEVAVRVDPAALAARFPALGRVLAEVRGLEAGVQIGERGLTLRLRALPKEGTSLADMLGSAEPRRMLWTGLAPEDAAFSAECALSPAGSRVLLDRLAGLLPFMAPAADLAPLCAGDLMLAAYPATTGWQAQAVCRVRDAGKAEPFLSRALVERLNGIAPKDGPLELSCDDMALREADRLALRETLVHGIAPAGAGRPWEALFGPGGRRVALAGALADDLLVMAAGGQAGERVAETAGPLRQGLVPKPSPGAAALLERLPAELNACVVLDLAGIRALLAESWPGLSALPASGRAAAGLRCLEGAAEIEVVMPPEAWAGLWALLAPAVVEPKPEPPPGAGKER